MSPSTPVAPPHEFSYDFSHPGAVVGGRHHDGLFEDIPPFAEYYVDDSKLAIPFGERLSPLLADWIDVAVAAYFADRFAVRCSPSVSRRHYHWGRVINLRVAVRQPKIWQRPEVWRSLSGLLGFITEDRWQFEFVEYKGEPRSSEINSQGSLFPLTGPTRVALYSGGLDSFAGLAQQMSGNSEHQFVLVSGVTNSRQQAGQRRQLRAIAEVLGQRPTHVTVPLRRSWREVQQAEEWSQRGRGFLFLTLGSATALAIQKHELFVFENGIGAINLPINGTQVGTYNSRAVNPITLIRMAEFIRVLTGINFTIHNPFLLHTKGEMCRHEVVTTIAQHVSDTFSCDGFPVRAHGRPQCGTCSSCLLRRISLMSANLHQHDRGYLVDIFDDTTTLSQDQQYVLSAMYWQARRIKQCLSRIDPWRALTCGFPALSGIEEAMAANGWLDRQLLRTALLRLYQKYGDEWSEFQLRCSRFVSASKHAA